MKSNCVPIQNCIVICWINERCHLVVWNYTIWFHQCTVNIKKVKKLEALCFRVIRPSHSCKQLDGNSSFIWTQRWTEIYFGGQCHCVLLNKSNNQPQLNYSRANYELKCLQCCWVKHVHEEHLIWSIVIHYHIELHVAVIAPCCQHFISH